MTSAAIATGSTWPFFVMPNFEQHARDVSELTLTPNPVTWKTTLTHNVYT